MKQKIRYGIIGFGRFAEKAIAPAIKQSPNSELMAIQNRSLAKARESARQLELALAFDNAEQLVVHPDVDAVFIVSPNSLHCSETLAAAKSGKHVLCEKPMAMNVAECEQMIDACERNNVKLMVGHMLRFSPLIIRMKELVHSGKVGRVIRAEANFVYDARLSTRAWLLERKIAGGGPVFDVGVHCLDTLRFVLDNEVTAVEGMLDPKPTTEATENSAQLVLRFSNGAIASIYTSYESPIRESYMEILGTEARISAIDFTVGGRSAELVIERRSAMTLPDVTVESIDVPNLYVEEVNHFSECILTDSEPHPSAHNVLMNQRVLDLAMTL